jgi:hypothetical protein
MMPPEPLAPPTDVERGKVIKQWPRAATWLWWVLATVIGAVIGLVLNIITIPLWFYRDSQFTLTGPQGAAVLFVWFELGALLMLPIALHQSFVLKRYCRKWRPWAWVTVSTVGAGLGLAVFYLAEHMLLHGTYTFILLNRKYLESSLILATTGAVILGCAQWLILRRNMNKAIWWIPANAVGWGVGWLITSLLAIAWPPAVVFPLGADANDLVLVRWITLCLVFVVIYAAIAGFALIWLLISDEDRRLVELTGSQKPLAL